MQVIIIMGALSDAEFTKKITRALDDLGIP